MTFGRKSSFHKAFDNAVEVHNALGDSGVISNEYFYKSLEGVEASGVLMIAETNQLTLYFATEMHRVILKAADVEVVPPHSEQQLALLAGKASVYAALIESSNVAKKDNNTPTSTKAAETDSRKK